MIPSQAGQAGAALQSSSLELESVAALLAITNAAELVNKVVTTAAYYNSKPYGGSSYLILEPAEYELYSGLSVGDGWRDHDLIGGKIAMLLPTNGVIGVQQCGAIPYDYTGAIPFDGTGVAADNTRAFRAAHLSLRSEWDARRLSYDPSTLLNQGVVLKNFYGNRDDPGGWVNDTTVYTNSVGYVAKTLTWATKVESGEYNLSSGYTVPKGMTSFGDEQGASKVLILNSTSEFPQLGGGGANANVIPAVSIGKCLIDYLLGTEGWAQYELEDFSNTTDLTAFPTKGIYVRDPAPLLKSMVVVPQNSNIAVEVSGVPGFVLSDLWLAASVGLRLGDGAADGQISKIIFDSGTLKAIDFGDCVNIMLSEIYTFDVNFGLYVSGAPDNIDIGLYQSNFTKYAPLTVAGTAAPTNFRIDRLVSKTQGTMASFLAIIDIAGISSDVSIGRIDANNYDGWAGIVTGAGNKLKIGTISIKQQAIAELSQGTTSKGFYVKNASVTIDKLETDVLHEPSEFVWERALAVIDGTLPTEFTIAGGFFEGHIDGGAQASTQALIGVTNSNPSTTIRVDNFDNKSLSAPLYEYTEIDPNTPTPQNYLPNVTYSKVRRPFPWVTGGGVQKMQIPFNKAGLYNLTIIVNTNVSGNIGYLKTAKYLVSVESTFDTGDAGLVWYASVAPLLNVTYGTFAPPIALQVDIGDVAGGFKIPKTTADLLTLSVPDTYGYVSYVLEPANYEII